MLALLRWILRRLWNSQVRRYRLLSRLVTALAVVRWIARRRQTAGRISLAKGETMVVEVRKPGTTGSDRATSVTSVRR